MIRIPFVKRFFLATGLLLWAAAAGGCIREDDADDIGATTLVHEGDPAPDFTVGMLDGSTTTLSSHRGKVVLLTFWNTWCPECGREMANAPGELARRFTGADFVFLPVARCEPLRDVATFADKQGYDFPIGIDPDGSVYGLYATKYVPRNILIDRSGTVAASSTGYTPETFSELVNRIGELLRQPDPDV